MIGKRIYPNEKGELIFKHGNYGKDSSGMWIIRTPNGITGTLPNHIVNEHENGTITVTPSIVINNGDNKWHGFLEKGVWKEV